MISTVRAKGCIQKRVKQGFIDRIQISRLLDAINPHGAMEVQKTIQWYNMIV